MEEYELEHAGCARQEAVLVRGGNRLCGELTVQGAKNSTLPLLAAALLCEGETVLHNCPALSDVHTAVTILRRLGCRCTHTGDTLTVCYIYPGKGRPTEFKAGKDSVTIHPH